METDNRQQTLRDFLTSTHTLTGKSEEELLSFLFIAQHYPELETDIVKHKDAIIDALTTRDTRILEKELSLLFSDAENRFSSLPEHVATALQSTTPEGEIDQQTIAARSKKAGLALDHTPMVADTVKTTTIKTRRAFIETLVKKYSTWSPLPPDEFVKKTTDAIIKETEENPSSPPETILTKSLQDPVIWNSPAPQRIQKNKELVRAIRSLQQDVVFNPSKQYVEAVLTAQDPAVFESALVQQITSSPIVDTTSFASVVTRASTLSTISSVLSADNQTPLDYAGFFKHISANGTPIEKVLAPLADAVFSVFPKDTKDAIVAKVLGASWDKDIANNTLLERTFGEALQTPQVQQAIQKGNALFAQSRQHGGVLTRTQVFVSDVFVTVFHPPVAVTYLQLSSINNANTPSSVQQFYLSSLAERGVYIAANKGVRKAGGVVAKKAAGTAIGKIVGALLGSAATPLGSLVGAFVGDIVIDKVLGAVWRGTKKVFSFLSLDWLGKLVSGQYESAPLTKDPTFMIPLLIVGAICILFVIPLLPFSIGGNPLFFQTVQDDAFIQGIGGGNTGGEAVNCVSDPTNPLCSMESCDTTKQDCRWPTSGTITQGPFTVCGGSHRSLNAIDIGTGNGTDVYATIEGEVVDLYSGCVDNTGSWGNTCGGGYGNWVVIRGKTYSLKFGHLSRLSIAVKKGQRVSPTTVIGEVDHNGNSSGPHLHFEYIGSGSINSILPVSIPTCSNNTTGCPACPSISVGGSL